MKRALKSLYYMIFNDSPDIILGEVLYRALTTSIIDRIKREMFNPNTSRGYITRCLVRVLERRYHLLTDHRKQSEMFNLWGGDAGSVFFDGIKSTQMPVYLRTRSIIVDLLKTRCQAHEVVVEIGTGNGVFIKYLQTVLPSDAKLVGIDINSNEIKKNLASLPQDSNVKFHFGTIDDWLYENKSAQVVVVVCGTLVWFPQTQVDDLFRTLSRCGRVSHICISEGVHHSITDNKKSIPGVGLFNHYHNYKYLLIKNGYEIIESRLFPPPIETPRGHTYWTAIARPTR